MGFEATHFVFVVSLGLVKLSFEDVKLLSKHVILMFVNVEVSQRFLINTIDSVEFLSFDFELNSGLGEVSIEFSLEVSIINHHLVVVSGFLFELP